MFIGFRYIQRCKTKKDSLIFPVSIYKLHFKLKNILTTNKNFANPDIFNLKDLVTAEFNINNQEFKLQNAQVKTSSDLGLNT